MTDYNVSSDGTIYIKPDAERKLGDITVRYYSELPKSKPGEADTFFAVDNKGNATGSLYTVKDGVSMSSFGGSGVYNGISEQFRIDNVKLSNDQDGKGLFEFFADNTRTGGKHHQGIEWSRFRLGDGSNLITTSHQEGHDWGASYALNSLFKAGIDIREFIHNHPNQNPESHLAMFRTPYLVVIKDLYMSSTKDIRLPQQVYTLPWARIIHIIHMNKFCLG